MRRRQFLSQAGSCAASTVLCSSLIGKEDEALSRFVGVQIHPFSFYDEGLESVLDLLQETAGVNAILVYTHLYAADQNVPKEVLAHDHPGFTPVSPHQRRYRKVWTKHNVKAFQDLKMQHDFEEKDVEYAGKSLFEELEPLCAARGIRLMGRILEPRAKHGTDLIAGFTDALTIDLHGNPGTNACWNNPDYRQFWETTVSDTFKQNPLAGFMLGAERTGPLYRLIQSGEPPSCFCRHCLARIQSKGIDESKLRAGYTALEEWILSMRNNSARPKDGAITTFLRILMQFPELLVWEREWALSLEESLQRLAYGIKSVERDALVGRHIDHQQSTWDIFYRAAISYSEMANAMDFLKPVVYHDIAAPRVKEWMIDEFSKSILADLSKNQSLDLFYSVFGLDATKEPSLEAMTQGGFSPDYVYRETRRCVEGVSGKAKVFPGIGFDIPFHQKNAPPRIHSSDPSRLEQATYKAMEAGADGLIICREYQEMTLKNLRAIGRALRNT